VSEGGCNAMYTCFLCGEPDPDYRANWLGNEYVHKDCDREAQRDEERRQMQHGHKLTPLHPADRFPPRAGEGEGA